MKKDNKKENDVTKKMWNNGKEFKVNLWDAVVYLKLSLKCKTSAIWLVETACISLILLTATVQISMECET